MRYIENDYDFVEVEEGSFGGYVKMPGFVTKVFLKANVKKLRSMMGGESKDISTRKINIEDKKIKGYKSDIGVRIYIPEGNETRPLMVFIHGGGWIAGSIDAVHHYCMAVADRANSVVISVDYHLAPEGPFPEGLEDCYAALKWAFNNSEMLNIDKDRISISGDSAGGNYSAVISIMARDRGDVKINKQILLYPATDLEDMASDKVGKQERIFGEVMLSMYLKNKVKPSDPRVSPMKCEDLTNLPEALLVVGDLDFLMESTLKYAKRLEEAGNDVSFSLYKNTRHAFIDNTGNCRQAEDFINEVAEFINKEANVVN